jgi:hypothetical protein
MKVNGRDTVVTNVVKFADMFSAMADARLRNADAFWELLGFLYAECCTRNKAVAPDKILCCR